MLEIKFTLKTETKTCYRFETGERPEQMTLYLKKTQVDAAGIDPKNGITVTVQESK
ncbi:MAG TPA: hypothetical protein PKJ47_12525 [Candidatus Limiplasma sp.]|nr:hypothetical protein [Candidatus Limiplasma sp.]